MMRNCLGINVPLMKRDAITCQGHWAKALPGIFPAEPVFSLTYTNILVHRTHIIQLDFKHHMRCNIEKTIQ